MEPGPCIICGEFAHNGHHRKLRSQGGGEDHWNIIRLCGSGTTGCHGLVHANPEAAYNSGLLVYSWADPKEVLVEPTLFKRLIRKELNATIDEILTEAEVHDHDGVAEGDECPTCHRRVPHKKKKSSPVTKVKALRVPLDDVETYDEIEEAAADHLGCKSKPHWKFWVHQYALVHLLQDPEAKDALAKPEEES